MNGTTAIIVSLFVFFAAVYYAHAEPDDIRHVQPRNGSVVMIQIRDADGEPVTKPSPYMFPLLPTQSIWLRTCNVEQMTCSDDWLQLEVVEPEGNQ